MTKTHGCSLKSLTPVPSVGLIGCMKSSLKLLCSAVIIYCLSAPIVLVTSCSSPSITAVNLVNTNEPDGMAYYLPKAYLFVTKNIRYIPTPTVGLTGTAPISQAFDSNSQAVSSGAGGSSKSGNTNSTGGAKQKSTSSSPSSSSGTDDALESDDQNGAAAAVSSTADGGAAPQKGAGGTQKTNDNSQMPPGNGGQVNIASNLGVVPPASISDGLIPQEFYTYQIIYLPDPAQKYGLRVKGGHGQMRATLNLVNGWMFTGPGPLGINTSSAAQTIAATGQAVGSFVQSAEQGVLSGLGIPSLGVQPPRPDKPRVKGGLAVRPTPAPWRFQII